MYRAERDVLVQIVSLLKCLILILLLREIRAYESKAFEDRSTMEYLFNKTPVNIEIFIS